MSASLLLLVVALAVSVALAEVTVLKYTQTLYDRSPKLRIKGSGFDAEEKDILLDISATGQASLVADKDFTVSKDEDGDGLILKLIQNKK